MKCNFCESTNLSHVYTPIKSKIALMVFICQQCGLVQTISDESLDHQVSTVSDESPRIFRLSCDADYSDIRVGKGQMVANALRSFEQHLKQESIREVLDLCSARGDFALSALDFFSLGSIDCIDPDLYMTVSYQHDPRINLQIGKYHELKTTKQYDLVYSCHTLEHYRDPSKYLRFAVNLIKPGKFLFLDVPNIDAIQDGRNIDEYFYDRHKYYFTRSILTQFLRSLGMELVGQNEGSYTIELLMKKTGFRREIDYDSQTVEQTHELISSYKTNIETNRSKLPAVASMIRDLGRSKVNVAFGCGRVLDAFLAYGKLDIEVFSLLIDNFLINATPELYGKPLYRTSILDTEHVDNIFLFTRSSTGALMADLTKQYPKTCVTHINALIDSL